MKFIRNLIPIALAAGLMVGLAPQPAAAAGPPGSEYGIRCDEGVCALSIDLDTSEEPEVANPGLFSLNLNDSISFLPEGTNLEISDDIVLKLPVGDIELFDTNLKVGLDEDYKVERLRGSAHLPVPGLFDDSESKHLLLTDIGMDKGANLSEFNASLIAEHSYLFFNVDSGFDLAAESDGHQFRLSVPEGRNAAIIFDVQEPQLYLSGNFNISHNGELTFLREVLAAGTLPLSLDILPIGQHANLNVSGSVGKQLDQAFLELGGGYAIDEGVLGDWIGLETTPLAVEGLITLNQDGLYISGLTGADIQPDTLFKGEIQAQTYIPFADAFETAYFELDGSAAVPLIDFSADATARLDGEMLVRATGDVRDQVSGWAQQAPDLSPDLSGVAEGLSARSAQGRDAAESGYAWLGQQFSTLYQSLRSQLPTNVAQNQ